MLSSLGPLPPITRSVTSAAALLAHHGPARGCGCPAWDTDPDSLPNRHVGRCPLGAVDEVFDSFAAVGKILQGELDTHGGSDLAWRRVADGVRRIDQTAAANACVAYGLALAGAARTRVRVQAVVNRRTHDLADPVVERFAVLDHVTRADTVPLGPETVVRLLLSNEPELEMERASELADAHDPAAASGDLALLFAATARAVNTEAVLLSGDTGRGQGRLMFSLPQLASDGFNLLVGINDATDLS